jgi:hypothetical protein
MKKNQIESVRIERVYDEMGQTDCIGEYTDKRTDWAICRHCGEYVAIAEIPNKRADEIEDELYDIEDDDPKVELLTKELDSLDLHDCPQWNREYNFFLPYAGGEEPGTEDYQKYGLQDYKRMEGLNNGDWNFIGIIAKAEIITPANIIQTIHSGGLWGIESDSGTFLDEVEKEALESLRTELESMGIGKRAIDYAFKNVETVNN